MPSGNSLLLMAYPLPKPEIPIAKLISYSLTDSSTTLIPSPPHFAWGNILVAPDGNSFCYRGARKDGPTQHDLFLQSFGDNKPRNLSAKNLDRPVGSVKFIDNGHLLAVIQNGFHNRLYTITMDGTISPYGLNRNLQSFDYSVKGNLYSIVIEMQLILRKSG